MNSNRPPYRAALTVSIGFMVLFSSGCSKSTNPVVEATPTYKTDATSQAPQVKMPELVAPKLAEVQDAVRRVFKDCAVIDTSTKPNFFIGDFNGDSSQDLAVVLRPVPGKLSDLNEEYPAWLLRDPLAVDRSTKTALSVAEDDHLLAIIHGYGDNNWRDTQATQTFLLKNVVGANITIQTGAEFLKSHSGRKLPRPQGDLIEQKLRGTDGYLYYARANYSWFDPKSYKQATDIGMVHGR